jgi:hypothetical protein
MHLGSTVEPEQFHLAKGIGHSFTLLYYLCLELLWITESLSGRIVFVSLVHPYRLSRANVLFAWLISHDWKYCSLICLWKNGWLISSRRWDILFYSSTNQLGLSYSFVFSTGCDMQHLGTGAHFFFFLAVCQRNVTHNVCVPAKLDNTIEEGTI